MRDIYLEGIGMTSQRTRSRLAQRLRETGITDKDVLTVIERTPRHIFVDEALSHRAYEDTALPIGLGQTISQPYIVARMTEALLATPTIPSKILEIGTGSGYQTAILAQLFDNICTIERIQALQHQAWQRLKTLHLTNVEYRHGDGAEGWPQKAPFDAIIVTAAVGELPEDLLTQLAVGGLMIIPVGRGDTQELQIIERTEDEFISKSIESVRFVPLIAGTIE